MTIIGGYLGAGKTTVINRLLSQNQGQRLAVLVNDFGALNIDRVIPMALAMVVFVAQSPTTWEQLWLR